MSGGHERVELRMRGRLTPRLAAAFSEMHVSECVETTLVTELAADDAARLLVAVGALRGEIIAIKVIDDKNSG